MTTGELTARREQRADGRVPARKGRGAGRATYIRDTDGAVMIEIAPHQFVNRAVAQQLGLALA